MSASLWLPILIKACTTAAVVVVAARLAERLGPFWGAVIASLPVAAGPAYVFLAMQHDAGFLAASALGSFAVNGATVLALVVYARLAGRHGLLLSMGLALAVWLALAALIGAQSWTPLTAAAVNVAAYTAAFRLLRGLPAAGPPPAPIAPRRRDLPLRAASVALFVVAVVLASQALGPQATGMAAVFPISLSSLLVILHPRIGGAAAALLAAAMLRAMIGFASMLLVLHLAIGPLGVTAAMLLALLASLGWSAGLLLQRRAAVRRRGADPRQAG